jgi:hypothetical protein
LDYSFNCSYKLFLGEIMVQIKDIGRELSNGSVKCLYRGCKKHCRSWSGLAIHLKKCHGIIAEEVKWSDIFE